MVCELWLQYYSDQIFAPARLEYSPASTFFFYFYPTTLPVLYQRANWRESFCPN